MKLVGHVPMELSFLIFTFLKKGRSENKVQGKMNGSRGDWETDLLSLDPSSPAEQSPQNLKKRSFV